MQQPIFVITQDNLSNSIEGTTVFSYAEKKSDCFDYCFNNESHFWAAKII